MVLINIQIIDKHVDSSTNWECQWSATQIGLFYEYNYAKVGCQHSTEFEFERVSSARFERNDLEIYCNRNTWIDDL